MTPGYDPFHKSGAHQTADSHSELKIRSYQDPDHQRKKIGRRMMEKAESALRKRGCPKINLQVRKSNQAVISFYEHLGYSDDDVIGLGKRL